MDKKSSKAVSFLSLGIILLGLGIFAYIYCTDENPTLDFEILR